jgi:hypothetical protein
MDFRGLRHEPVNEQGVVLLFGMVAKELGYIVEAVQSGFPDCEAKRQIAPQRWQRVHIEFEFESRNFRDHGHPITGCDIIVCWRHNWPDPPSPPRSPRTLLPPQIFAKVRPRRLAATPVIVIKHQPRVLTLNHEPVILRHKDFVHAGSKKQTLSS